MKKLIVATLAVILFLCACAGGGSAQAEGAPKQTEYDAVFESLDFDAASDVEVIRHKETGVCYLVAYTRSRNGAGVTVMVNPDGSPYVWEEENE